MFRLRTIVITLAAAKLSGAALAQPVDYVEERPIRGAWWRPVNSSLALENALNRLEEAGITDLFLETFYHGLSSADSDIMNERFGYDYLELTVTEARKRGIRVHAWLEAAYMDFGGLGSYLLDANPGWKVVDDHLNTDIGDISGQRFVNLGNPGVQQLLRDYCAELATNYPTLWGIHTDYHRFPLDNDTSDGNPAPYSFDDWSRTTFESIYGVDPLVAARFPGQSHYNQFVAFRREGIAKAAGEMKAGIDSVDSGIMFSGAIFASAVTSSLQLVKMQDWPLMAANGWLPTVVPMAYGSSTTSIRNDIRTAVNQRNGSRIVPGLAIINPNNRPGIFDQLTTVYNEDLDSFVWFEANALTGLQADIDTHRNFIEANGPFQTADFDLDLDIDGTDWDNFFAALPSGPNVNFATRIYDLTGDNRLDGDDEAAFLQAFRAFRFQSDGRVGQVEFDAVLAEFTGPGETFPNHLYDLTGDGVVDCADVGRLRLLITDPVSIESNPDLNSDGFVTPSDVLLFVADLEAGEPGTDLDANSGSDFFDLLRFLEITGSACP